MVVVPLKSAVGLEFTVITAEPLMSAAMDEHLLSLTDVNVYVFVAAGVTVNV